MNKYAIYNETGNWLFDIHADSEDEAVAQAKKADQTAYKARLVAMDKP